ncbi:MAG: o-succinylbenzoate synthase [Flavobacteriales bacterium]|nr:o-succinylbenzoate synthase [Flavobacteriales bacterium]
MKYGYSIEKHVLEFKKPARTSRNEFVFKNHWILKVWNRENPEIKGVGEAAPIQFLSPDYNDRLEAVIEQTINILDRDSRFEVNAIKGMPSVAFAIESAFLDLKMGGRQIYFRTDYLKGKPIEINGLIWMAGIDEMLEEAKEKLKSGFTCLKLKVGQHDFDSECRLLENIRKLKGAEKVELRLDANGAFTEADALQKINSFSKYGIHSIEQPVKQGQKELMAYLCKEAQIPVVLDEELIGIEDDDEMRSLIAEIQPSYLVLKPTLVGGFSRCDRWIRFAEENSVGWWVTSALEGNIGLNAIAQWVSKYSPTLKQGLGTGTLYKTNFRSFSEIRSGKLFYTGINEV